MEREAFLIDSFERLIQTDPGCRGIEALFPSTRGRLLAATKDLVGAKRVLVTTGFFVPAGAPESDGPLGAAALILALHALDIPVDVLVDPACVRVGEAIQTFVARRSVHVVGVRVFPGPLGSDAYHSSEERKRMRSEVQMHSALQNSAEARAVTFTELLAGGEGDDPYTHLVSIERVGAAADGNYYSMRARDLSANTGMIDGLFAFAANTKSTSIIAIGDGGNEIGMGNVKELTSTSIPYGDLIACVTECDHLICCGVSNWGGYALAASLLILRARQKSPHSMPANAIWRAELDDELVADLVSVGVVDGTSGVVTTQSIDGLSRQDVHRPLIAMIQAACLTALERVDR